MSGQVINIEKSSIFFSKNTGEGCRSEILSILGGMNQVRQSKYLGLPMVIERIKRQVFNYIREKMSSKLRGQKEKFLSNAGKKVLLKSVVLAMPTYAMVCGKLPKTLCKDICIEMAIFWWRSNEDKKKIHWLGWKKMSEIKGKGGLAFKDLLDFNTAMLAK